MTRSENRVRWLRLTIVRHDPLNESKNSSCEHRREESQLSRSDPARRPIISGNRQILQPYHPNCFLAASDILPASQGGSQTSSMWTAFTSGKWRRIESSAVLLRYACNGQAGVVIVILTKTLSLITSIPYTRPRSTMLIPISGSLTSLSAARTSASVGRFTTTTPLRGNSGLQTYLPLSPNFTRRLRCL